MINPQLLQLDSCFEREQWTLGNERAQETPKKETSNTRNDKTDRECGLATLDHLVLGFENH